MMRKVAICFLLLVLVFTVGCSHTTEQAHSTPSSPLIGSWKAVSGYMDGIEALEFLDSGTCIVTQLGSSSGWTYAIIDESRVEIKSAAGDDIILNYSVSGDVLTVLWGSKGLKLRRQS